MVFSPSSASAAHLLSLPLPGPQSQQAWSSILGFWETCLPQSVAPEAQPRPSVSPLGRLKQLGKNTYSQLLELLFPFLADKWGKTEDAVAFKWSKAGGSL